MDYAIYKGIRGAAWQCLIDSGIKSLPVSVGSIAAHYGIDIKGNSDVQILSNDEAGRIIISDVPTIIVNDTQPVQRCRYTIAHELGHYLLGHLGDNVSRLSHGNVNAPQEQEADAFAARILMPACVLWRLDLHTAQEISEACYVSMQAAQIRADRMATLYSRNKFLTNRLELAVLSQFFGDNY